jgi:hypothetical protein
MHDVPHVDEIELIERQRLVVLALSGFIAFLALTYFGQALFASAFYAMGIGLIVSGGSHAYRITQEVPWAYVLAESRLSGGTPTKRGMWLGGIVPGVAVLAIGYWWHPRGV